MAICGRNAPSLGLKALNPDDGGEYYSTEKEYFMAKREICATATGLKKSATERN